VIDVIDGDTITVALEGRVETIRYLGIDAPEMKASDPYFGRLAKQRNRSLVAGESVMLYQGDTDSDDFGRLLRFVYVEEVFVNRLLVEEGLATSFNRPHDAACAELFTEAMLDAYHARTGIWEGIDKVYQDGPPLCPNGCEDHPRGCNIKGNITAQDDYIYHVPSSPDYPDVKIQPEKGERWFCTLEEALNMGWRPPRQE
jgi:micrococcal nuclease